MRLLLDQNISHRVVKLIQEHFPNSSSVKNEFLTNANDGIVWDYAKKHGFAVVTFDEDFFNIQLSRGLPPKIIWFKTGNISNQQVAEYLI
jgi:predicted nuclease of predicted toxin-antitoxin system